MYIKVGTAGWSIPGDSAGEFPADGSSLERYSSRLPVVEINSSFHRAHRISTWQRWAESVPRGFRFSVKVPKTITHQAKLTNCSLLLDEFVAQTDALGEKLAVLLVQLPPKLEFNLEQARSFFEELDARSGAKIAIEPRNTSWFTSDANAFLVDRKIARVAADPAVSPTGGEPGGWLGLSYWRLHGSPVLYRSSYAERIDELAARMLKNAQPTADAWCIFDNTASSAAAGDALALLEKLHELN